MNKFKVGDEVYVDDKRLSFYGKVLIITSEFSINTPDYAMFYLTYKNKEDQPTPNLIYSMSLHSGDLIMFKSKEHQDFEQKMEKMLNDI